MPKKNSANSGFGNECLHEDGKTRPCQGFKFTTFGMMYILNITFFNLWLKPLVYGIFVIRVHVIQTEEKCTPFIYSGGHNTWKNPLG